MTRLFGAGHKMGQSHDSACPYWPSSVHISVSFLAIEDRIVFWHYIQYSFAFIWFPASPLSDARSRLPFTVLISEECWLADKRLAVLLLSDISLHAHSGSQEAERQGSHSIGCVIRIINQSIFPVNLSQQIIQQLKYGGIDMGFWDRVFGYKEISSGAEKL